MSNQKKIFYKIEYMSTLEDKIDEISDEYVYYYVKYNDLQRTSRENDGSRVGKLQPIMEGKAYNSMIKQHKKRDK